MGRVAALTDETFCRWRSSLICKSKPNIRCAFVNHSRCHKQECWKQKWYVEVSWLWRSVSIDMAIYSSCRDSLGHSTFRSLHTPTVLNNGKRYWIINLLTGEAAAYLTCEEENKRWMVLFSIDSAISQPIWVSVKLDKICPSALSADVVEIIQINQSWWVTHDTLHII